MMEQVSHSCHSIQSQFRWLSKRIDHNTAKGSRLPGPLSKAGPAASGQGIAGAPVLGYYARPQSRLVAVGIFCGFWKIHKIQSVIGEIQ